MIHNKKTHHKQQINGGREGYTSTLPWWSDRDFTPSQFVLCESNTRPQQVSTASDKDHDGNKDHNMKTTPICEDKEAIISLHSKIQLLHLFLDL